MYFVLLFLGIFGYVAYKLTIFTKGRSFDDYRQNHPENVANGRVTCYSCGGGDVFLRKAGNSLTSIMNSHVCKQCGSELYRSKTSL